MEAAFGRDLGAVRTFSGASVDAEARRLGAAAFTIGPAVALPSSAPAMRSPAGRRLLAHELTHVLQQERAGSALVQRAECSLGHLDKECAGAAASCASGAADYCATTYPTAAKLDEKWRKIDQLATDQSGELPNAAANLHHFLGATGVERVMPSEVFASHKKTIAALDVHREKLLAGAKKRLENGTTAPGALSEEMAWTGTVQTFNMLKEDLGLAVGGFTLCSKARFTATKGSGDTYDVTLDPWTAQAFDCYNWDPGKGIGVGVGELNDMDMCCLENAGRGKHFRVRTEPWVVSATNTGSVTAVVNTGGAGGGGGSGGGDGGSGGGESKPSKICSAGTGCAARSSAAERYCFFGDVPRGTVKVNIRPWSPASSIVPLAPSSPALPGRFQLNAAEPSACAPGVRGSSGASLSDGSARLTPARRLVPGRKPGL